MTLTSIILENAKAELVLRRTIAEMQAQVDQEVSA